MIRQKPSQSSLANMNALALNPFRLVLEPDLKISARLHATAKSVGKPADACFRLWI